MYEQCALAIAHVGIWPPTDWGFCAHAQHTWASGANAGFMNCLRLTWPRCATAPHLCYVDGVLQKALSHQ